jgi:kynurenine formamidase
VVGTLKFTVEILGRSYGADLAKPIDISIPVAFEGERFRAFGAEPADMVPYGAGDSVLSVAEGAGCNCPVFRFSAHLHGTHTECVGHISGQSYAVQDLVPDRPFALAQLVTLSPILGRDCTESYQPELRDQDHLLTRRALREAIPHRPQAVDALVIRTTPNEPEKRRRDYGLTSVPYFTNEAMVYIRELGVNLLLVDVPSVDRAEDQGMLSNHHIFWDVDQGSHDVGTPSSRAITEFVYVPNGVKDGTYLLNLNIGNIRSDAAPSRPILYEIRGL